MKTAVSILLLLLSINSHAQKNLKIELTESYELGNIILALTEYGKTDPWDVQKIPPYYDEIIQYFEPVKNHPLLDSVNYSRKDWEKFLGFRTDMYAFSFDNTGKLKRDYPFNSFGPKEVDKNLDLINDFVQQSNYRQFFRQHQGFYNQLISNYNSYHFIQESFGFLNKIAEKPPKLNSNYIIAISPLVGGQNCHRDIDSLTTVDFPNIGGDLVLGNLKANVYRRLMDNHAIFTEMDHGYVNPISDRYAEKIRHNFVRDKWNSAKGYPGISTFNEYMTWAVFDLFIQEKFPEAKTDSISGIFSKLNVARGFFAQHIFSEKLSQLYQKSKSKKLESLYEPMLKWAGTVQKTLSQPKLLNSDTKNYIQLKDNKVVLNFSESMKQSKNIEIVLYQFENGKQTRNNKTVLIENLEWSADGKTASFPLITDFREYAIGFYQQNSLQGLYSENKILLDPNSYILIKK